MPKLKKLIRKGDTTTHGGVVLEGIDMFPIMGEPASKIGHMVACPQCKGIYPIIEGVSGFSIFGEGVAVEGMKTSCGAELIASQSQVSVEVFDELRLTDDDINRFISNADNATLVASLGNVSTGKRPKKESDYFPEKSKTKVPLTYENTVAWLKRSKIAEDENYLDSYSYLNYARNVLSLDVNDTNLVAAERYAEGYFGNYGRGFILGQDFLKKFRSTSVGRKMFGKNGSPVSDSEYVTTWGFMGVSDREEFIKKYKHPPKKMNAERAR